MDSLRPAIVKGWDMPKEHYISAHQENKLLKLVIELSNVCNLSCAGCFTKRVGDDWDVRSKKRLPDEMSYEVQMALLEEAAALGAKAVDIVGAGEPTLDPRFEDVMLKINSLGMHAIVFTHGVTKRMEELERWKGMSMSFFIKLWSKNPNLQNLYVAGSIPNYSHRRDESVKRLIEMGFNQGEDKFFDGINYRTTRLGADILVMRDNYDEIPDLFRFCRRNNILPEIKTYIPEGPTRFDQEANLRLYTSKILNQLTENEVTPNAFSFLRKQLEDIDWHEHGIGRLNAVYPQGTKCTQSMGALYVTIKGDIRSCVGSHVSYGNYEPYKAMLKKVLEKRRTREKVSFGCIPRAEDAKLRALPILPELEAIYRSGEL
jgi:MoaA/NifB/PqqE/SkfB family radical SAM enzyme